MGGLSTRITRARAKLMGTTSTDIPAPFEIRCDCGQTTAGIRKPTSQQIPCSACGKTNFILPVNVYPSTRSVPSEVVGGPFSRRLLAAARELIPLKAADEQLRPPDAETKSGNHGELSDTEEVVVSVLEQTDEYPENGVEAGELPPRRSASARGRRPAASPQPKVREAAATPGFRLPQLKLPQVDVRRAARRTLTPFRLLMLGAIISAVATGWIIRNKARHDQALQVWRDSMDLAEASLVENNLTELNSALQAAVNAAAVLQRTDNEVQRAINLLTETQAVNQLSPVDISSELSGAYDKSGLLNRSRAETAEAALPGGWYVFDCPIRIMDERPSLAILDLPLMAGSDRVIVEVQSSLLVETAAAMEPDSVLFAARISGCRPPLSYGNSWRIQLDPESCALITTAVHARSAGLDPDESATIRERIERQKQILESLDLYELKSQDRRRLEEADAEEE